MFKSKSKYPIQFPNVQTLKGGVSPSVVEEEEVISTDIPTNRPLIMWKAWLRQVRASLLRIRLFNTRASSSQITTFPGCLGPVCHLLTDTFLPHTVEAPVKLRGHPGLPPHCRGCWCESHTHHQWLPNHRKYFSVRDSNPPGELTEERN